MTFDSSFAAPHKPGAVTVTDINSTTINISWSIPDRKTGITVYQATAQDDVENADRSCRVNGNTGILQSISFQSNVSAYINRQL